MKDRLLYRPRFGFDASPTLWKFFQDDAFVTGVLGPLGSGKSTVCCAKIMKYAMTQAPSKNGYRRTRWGVIRNSYPELRTTTLQTWLDMFPEAHCGPVNYAHPITHHIVRPPHGGQPGIDCEVLFLALDRPQDVKRLKSLDLTGAWLNEAVELPAGVVDMMTGRVGRFPKVDDVPATWAGIMMDTNAPDDHSWWYDYAEKREGIPQAIDMKALGIEGLEYAWHFYRQPPAVLEVEPIGREFFISEKGYEPQEVDPRGVVFSAGRYWAVTPEAENLKYLRPGYYHQQIQNKTLEWINRFLQAKYVYLTDGKPWIPEYSDAVMARPLNIDKRLPLVGGIDVGGGTLNPAAVIGQRGMLGDWRTLFELSVFDIGIDRFTTLLRQEIADKFRGLGTPRFWLDPAAISRDQVYETAVEEHMRSRGFDVQLAPSNDISVRREALALPMGRMMVVDGKASPGFLVNSGTDELPGCPMLRAALSGKWKRKMIRTKGREDRVDEKPDKGPYSHIGDAASYMCLGGGEHSTLVQSPNQKAFSNPATAVHEFNPFTGSAY